MISLKIQLHISFSFTLHLHIFGGVVYPSTVFFVGNLILDGQEISAHGFVPNRETHGPRNKLFDRYSPMTAIVNEIKEDAKIRPADLDILLEPF